MKVYFFADGHALYVVKSLNHNEVRVQERQHGKLVRVEKAWRLFLLFTWPWRAGVGPRRRDFVKK